ncbi:RNA exonuclease 1 homolog [Bufo bufo]|uniref:RNA exonuclease 1 homolog n=1 Tax=Bufo bufo TaxID=8384 RepID=UPI001ABEA96E|nr:RNA exonuclease 1 homolog [Bufo bufo]
MMLKNTGYFRAIECPFSDSCLRPHCLFKHGGRVGSGRARNDAEYEPPELSVVPPSMDEARNKHVLELERVNRAIEEVKSQVEREQRKYQELLETQKGPSKSLQPGGPSVCEYDPGCSGSRAACYSPTPLEPPAKPCKYTLEPARHDGRKRQYLEYVPKAVAPAPGRRPHKYVIDHSKPSTDLEYDPMVNYSARLLSKKKPEKETKRSRTHSQGEDQTASKRSRTHSQGEDQTASKRSRTHSQGEDQTASTERSTYSPSEGQTASKRSRTHSQGEGQIASTERSRTYSPGEGHTASSKRSRMSKIMVEAKCSSDSDSPSPDVNEGGDLVAQYDVDDAGNSLKSFKKLDKDLKPKSGKSERIKEPPLDSGQVMRTSKESKKVSSKHLKKNTEQVHNVHKQKKQEKPSEKTENEKTVFPKTPILRKNKKDNENVSKKKSSKKDSMGKKGDLKNGKHSTKHGKSLPLEKLKRAAQETCKVDSNMKSLCHADLFGDDTSDEEENRKTSKPRNATSNKWEKSAAKSKVTTRTTSVSSLDSPEIDLDWDSDPDPMEECLRVFNESHDVKTEDKGRMGKKTSENEEKSQLSLVPSVTGQKKRISHVTNANNGDSSRKPAARPYSLLTPQEICYERIQRAQEQAAQLLREQKSALLVSIAHKIHSEKTLSKTSAPRSPGVCEKKAQLPGTAETCNGSSLAVKSRTLSGMASKTSSATRERRRAHVPSLQSAALKRPVLPTEFGAKVPTTVRQRYLNLFIDECLVSCPSQEEAFNKALEEEKMVYSRSSSRNIYLNVAVNTLKKLRSQGSEKKATYPKGNQKTVSHEAVLAGKLAANSSFSARIRQDEELTEATIYKNLMKYILTPEQLKEHGYPLAHPDKSGRAVVFSGEEIKNSDSSCKVCCRCGAEYLVTPSGKCVRREECNFHWGRLRRQRGPGGLETFYNCCSGAVGSVGCQVAQQHVPDGRKENLDGFVKTFEKLNRLEGNHGVFALDCEMCYTTRGLELTRVTVVNSQLKVVYDTFVKPDNKIVDYNTRFSGVTEEDLQNTSITMRDVQAVLLCMFSSDSILIGHSLESDLFALKLIHQTVVDTAVVFPHRLGLPYKRALRTLMGEYLKRIIQDSVEGHDSSEDACSCMELMIWRLKEDAKLKR